MEQEILNKILRRNTWWVTSKVEETRLRQYKRPVFDTIIKKRLDNRRIISLSGLRRVGKTTLMYQIVEYLLKNKVNNPEEILFVSFDEIITADNKTFDEIFEWYLTKILKGEESKRRLYLFIDEIHFLPHWDRILKSYYENYPDIKFIISGSASIKLQKGHRESLVGRIDEILMLPFAFREVTYLANIKLKLNPKDLEDTYIKIPEKTKIKIKALFEKYISFGGLPEVYIENYEADTWQEYLFNDVVKKIIFEDMVGAYRIRRPGSLVKLLKYFSYNLSGYYEPTNIGNKLNMNRDMVEYYLNYLTQTSLVFLSQRLGKEELKSREKTYLGDVGIRNALLGVEEGDTRVIENIIFLHLFPLKPKYWKNKREVDFILKFKNTLVPIESKYASGITGHDISGLLEFMKKFSCNKGIILTKDLFKIRKEFKNEKTIAYIPVWLFLLLSPENIVDLYNSIENEGKKKER